MDAKSAFWTDLKDLRAAGYVEGIREAGWQVEDAKAAKYRPYDCKRAGYTYDEVCFEGFGNGSRNARDEWEGGEGCADSNVATPTRRCLSVALNLLVRVLPALTLGACHLVSLAEWPKFNLWGDETPRTLSSPRYSAIRR